MQRPVAERMFFTPQLQWREANRLLETAHLRYGSHFSTEQQCNRYFSFIITPKSKRWSYRANGKSGSSSTLLYLFRLEFGHECTAKYVAPDNMNSDAIAHELTRHDVFRHPQHRDDISSIPDLLENSLRLLTVRDPSKRALSSYRYFCESQRLSIAQFARERSRICALVGFDWERDSLTYEGFLRFLEYVKIEIEETNGTNEVNGHWRPQFYNTRPDVISPDLMGRLEDLETFYRGIAERLEEDPRPAAEHAAHVSNPTAGSATSYKDWVKTAEAKTLLRDCYDIDYQTFSYEP